MRVSCSSPNRADSSSLAALKPARSMTARRSPVCFALRSRRNRRGTISWGLAIPTFASMCRRCADWERIIRFFRGAIRTANQRLSLSPEFSDLQSSSWETWWSTLWALLSLDPPAGLTGAGVAGRLGLQVVLGGMDDDRFADDGIGPGRQGKVREV